jgi:hydroxymethylbilane synthase
MTDVFRIGTRGSPLALAQAHETRFRLIEAHGFDEAQLEIVVISTAGDRNQSQPLTEIGGKGLFTIELEDALRSGEIDLAVHSMKDMTTALPVGLEFGAVLRREDVRDAFVSLSAGSLGDLKKGATVGSSSVRRTAQALRVRPDLKTVQFRGNVQTRLRKLQEGVADATFLAVAGLKRLGLEQHITRIMETDEMLPAVAQGAIAVEIASNNRRARDLVAAIHDVQSGVAVACERAFLAELEGSCRTPIAGYAQIQSGMIRFRGEILSLDGQTSARCDVSGRVDDASVMARDAARDLRNRMRDDT